MAILMRGGLYGDFDPSKLRPREWAVVMADDPSAKDGKTIYICFSAGNVKRIATHEDMLDIITDATDEILEQYIQIFDGIKVEMEQLKAATEGYKDISVEKAGEAAESATSASTSATNAAASAGDSQDYSMRSKSYAVGTGGEVRPNDDEDCAKYYYQKIMQTAQDIEGLFTFNGTISFLELDTVEKKPGYVYNINEDFITDERFREGAYHAYPAGTDVCYTIGGFWDCLSGVSVVGVKGEKEDSFRTGYVILTAENVGAVATDGDASATTVTFSEAEGRENVVSGETQSTLWGKVKKLFTDLKNIAFTASYSDLTDTPSIPTKTSDLENDSGFITTDESGSIWKPNTKTQEGYVAKGEGNANKVWKTDADGNPGWGDAEANAGVTGVKGDAETTYRTGDVNITPANIGLGNVGNYKSVSTVADQGLSETEKANARANIGADENSFSGNYEDLTNKPDIPAAVAVKGNMETDYRVGNVNLTPENIGAARKEFFTIAYDEKAIIREAGRAFTRILSLRGINRNRLGVYILSGYGAGTNDRYNIQVLMKPTYDFYTIVVNENTFVMQNNSETEVQCSLVTILGEPPAAIDILKNTNTEGDTATSTALKTLAMPETMSKNSEGGFPANKTLGTDENGNLVWSEGAGGDEYELKSIYGDNAVSMGRKYGTTVGGAKFCFRPKYNSKRRIFTCRRKRNECNCAMRAFGRKLHICIQRLRAFRRRSDARKRHRISHRRILHDC